MVHRPAAGERKGIIFRWCCIVGGEVDGGLLERVLRAIVRAS